MTQPNDLPDVTMVRQRAELLRKLRRFFDQRGFFEVQPPCLSRSAVVDAYIDPIKVDSRQLRLAESIPHELYLQTSPELAMKRMLAAGSPSIYSIGPVFRSGERGRHHNIEFTMLEWYDVGAGGDDEIALLGELAAEMLGHDRWDVRTYRQLFCDELGFDPITTPLETLQARVAQIDGELVTAIGGDRDALLDVLLSESIQPQLGNQRPLIVKDYPVSQAALARPSMQDPECAARFELFYQGVELANGYDELLDADVLVQRAQRSNHLRRAAGREEIAAENSLATAMRHGLPACSGVALGVDRFLMVLTGQESLARVMPFSTENA